IFLTDEDDCSVADTQDGFFMRDDAVRHRGTAACSSDPQSSCCRSCGSEEDSPPEGCDELSRDASCLLGELDVTFDDPNVRCFDQRRRFGETYLFPVERYIRGLTSPTIVDGRGEAVPNPLYADGRTPDMVHVALLAGVP